MHKGKMLGSVLLSCIDGTPTLPMPCPVRVEPHENGLLLRPFKSTGLFKVEELDHLFFPYNQIDFATVKTHEEIQKDVTLGRLLVFGILAFGLKKKHVNREVYLTLQGHDESGQEHQLIFEAQSGKEKETRKIADTINSARNLYLKTHPKTHPQPSQQATASSIDLASQIERLAALVDKGFLTRDEFEAKKKDLLSCM